MITRSRFFMVLLLSIGRVWAVEPDLTAQQILLNMSQAMAALNYQGTVAFLKNDQLEPMRYSHAVHDGVQQERLVSLNSPLREIIRDSDQVSCLYKESQQNFVDHRPFERSFLLDMPANLVGAAEVYQFERMGEENVALHPSYVIDVLPKDQARYPRRIWVEKQQFLPLKAVLYDNNGLAIEQFVFTEFEIKENLPFVDLKAAELTRPPDPHVPQDLPPSSEQAAFVVTAMPNGFKELFFARKPMHNTGQPVEHLLLGDGFTLVSIYMETTSPGMPSGLQSVGAVNSYSRTLANFQLTVMGEVPAETVKQIAEGIQLR